MNTILNRSAQFLILIYKALVSPFLPQACRFTPTCSCYAFTCFANHSFGRAVRLSVTRLLHCRPGYPGGYDPVPEER